MIPSDIQAYLLETHSIEISQANALGGGCIHHAHHIATNQGSFFIKWNSLDQLHNFQVEKKGLELLRQSSTVGIPRTHFIGQVNQKAFLVLEFIESGRKAGDYWEDFGRKLAQLHQQSSSYFGLVYDNYIGALPQSNKQHEDWIEFFIQERLKATLKMAQERGLISASLIKDFEHLFAQLPQLLPTEAPALIHGDLWGGNIMVGPDGFVRIFDPAVYYAHREIELAFMTLFDRQPDRFYQAYQEVYPLETGWQSRFDLYKLYPLLVHVNLFGTSYLGSVKQILGRYV